MAKLEISKIEGTNGISLRDYNILIDGQEPSKLLGIKIDMNTEQFNQATITFGVDEATIDGDFLSMIEAKLGKHSKVEKS